MEKTKGMKILSCGAGMQSTALALMRCGCCPVRCNRPFSVFAGCTMVVSMDRICFFILSP